MTTVGDAGRQAVQPSWTPDGSGIIFVEQDRPIEDARMSLVLPDGTGLTAPPTSGDLFGTHPRLQLTADIGNILVGGHGAPR